MIYDGHVHVSVDLVDSKETINEQSLKIDELIKKMDNLDIKKALIMIDPSIKKLFCKENNRHRIKTVDLVGNNLQIICTSCKTSIYEGPDPLRKFNEKLLMESQKYSDRLLPFVFLSISNSTIVDEVKYFEEKFGGSFFGYKLHPSFSGRAITEISDFPSKKTLLVHTGVDKHTNPGNVIEFSKRYAGNMILAHFAKLNYESLKAVSESDKLFVDSSPATRIIFLKREQFSRVFNHQYFKTVFDESDLYYAAINLPLADKLIYGSDSPYGGLEEELEIFKGLRLSQEVREKIGYLNLLRAIGEK